MNRTQELAEAAAVVPLTLVVAMLAAGSLTAGAEEPAAAAAAAPAARLPCCRSCGCRAAAGPDPATRVADPGLRHERRAPASPRRPVRAQRLDDDLGRARALHDLAGSRALLAASCAARTSFGHGPHRLRPGHDPVVGVRLRPVFSSGSAFLGTKFAMLHGVSALPNSDYAYWVSERLRCTSSCSRSSPASSWARSPSA
jgi:hypothetical protein